MAVGEPPPSSPPHEVTEKQPTVPLVFGSLQIQDSIVKSICVNSKPPKSHPPPCDNSETPKPHTFPPKPTYADILSGVPTKKIEDSLKNSASFKIPDNDGGCHGRVQLKPTTTYLGKPAVIFSNSDKQSLIQSMKYVLVAKFSHGKPGLATVKDYFANSNLKSICNISVYDSKHLILECEAFEDFVKIWMSKQCMVGGFRMRIFKWREDFRPSFESPICPIWVHLPGLPLYLYQEDTLMSIANAIGRPLALDLDNINRSKLGCASFCVEVDVSVEVIDKIWIAFEITGASVGRQGVWQKVIFDKLPPYCKRCAHLGHSIECCLRIDKLENNVMRGDIVEGEERFDGECGTGQIGDEVQATFQVLAGVPGLAGVEGLELAGTTVAKVLAGDSGLAGAAGSADLDCETHLTNLQQPKGLDFLESTMPVLSQGAVRAQLTSITKGAQLEQDNAICEQVHRHDKGMEHSDEGMFSAGVIPAVQADGQIRTTCCNSSASHEAEVLIEDLTLEEGEIEEQDELGSVTGDIAARKPAVVEPAAGDLSAGKSSTGELLHRVLEPAIAGEPLAGTPAGEQVLLQAGAEQEKKATWVTKSMCDGGTNYSSKDPLLAGNLKADGCAEASETEGLKQDTYHIQQISVTPMGLVHDSIQSAGEVVGQMQGLGEQALHFKEVEENFMQGNKEPWAAQVEKAEEEGVVLENTLPVVSQDEDSDEDEINGTLADLHKQVMGFKSSKDGPLVEEEVKNKNKKQDIRLTSQLSPSEVKDCAKKELAKVYSSPTSTLPSIINLHIPDKDGNAVPLSAIIEKSAGVTELSKQLSKMRNLDERLKGEHGLDFLRATGDYDKYVTWYTIEILQTLKDHSQTSFCKDSTTYNFTPLDKEVIKKGIEWSTPKRRGRDRNK